MSDDKLVLSVAEAILCGPTYNFDNADVTDAVLDAERALDVCRPLIEAPLLARLGQLEAQIEYLLTTLKESREFGAERHRLWREASDVIHTMNYPEADADLLDAVASEIACGGNHLQCGFCSYEYDTNASDCSRNNDPNDKIGCRWDAKCQLEALSKALRARAALAGGVKP